MSAEKIQKATHEVKWKLLLELPVEFLETKKNTDMASHVAAHILS